MSSKQLTELKTLLVSPQIVNRIESTKAEHQDNQKLRAMAFTEVLDNPGLQKCTPNSIAGALVKSAKLGLYPGSAMGEAYFVPYGKECQLIIGYRGMIALARRSGQIKSLTAHCVYENDEFNYELGLEDKLVHKPAQEERGRFIAAYAVAKLKDGGHQFVVMYKQEIDKIRGNKRGQWQDHYEEMAKKTCIRRLFKYLPISIEMLEANRLEDKASEGQNLEKEIEPEKNVLDLDVSEYQTIETTSQTEELKSVIQSKEVQNG